MWIFVDESMIRSYIPISNQLLETDVLCHFSLEQIWNIRSLWYCKKYKYKSTFDSVPYSILHALHAPYLIHFIFCLSAFSTLKKHKMIFVQRWAFTCNEWNQSSRKWIDNKTNISENPISNDFFSNVAVHFQLNWHFRMERKKMKPFSIEHWANVACCLLMNGEWNDGNLFLAEMEVRFKLISLLIGDFYLLCNEKITTLTW